MLIVLFRLLIYDILKMTSNVIHSHIQSIYNHFHSCHPSGVCISVFKVHMISNARLVGCVLVRLSPNWPNTNDTAVNVIHCDSYSTEIACSRRGVNVPACLVAEQRTVSKTQQVESVYRTLCQYVICFPSYPREGNTGQLKHAQPDFQIVFIQEPFSPWTKDALWTVQ